MASRWRSSFPGPSSTGSESEHALQDFREPVAEVAIGEEDKRQAACGQVIGDFSYHLGLWNTAYKYLRTEW